MSYAPEQIENLFGPILIGTLLSMTLQGILFYQVYEYILKFSKSRQAKSAVYYICIMEIVHTGYSMGIVFQPLILDNGKPRAFQTYPVLLVAGPALAAAVSTPIQFFTSWRIFCVQQSFYVPLTICVFSLISTGGAFATCVQTQRYRLYSERDKRVEIPVAIWMGFGAVCDLLISVALSCTLYKRKTGRRIMDAILAEIIRRAFDC
ncbi:hypothetical protein BJ165DRAFT_1530229 [Panaeolus papilionaceus]|nr:hypothetical protein BJ165DRAFT_1530229 [Panaeolus papilionaceus]